MTSTHIVPCGPCHLYFGGEDLGYTLDGVILTYSEETQERLVDTSDVAIDIVVTKRSCTVEATLAEYSLQKLSKLLGEHHKFATDGTNSHLAINGGLQGSKQAVAKELHLAPLGAGADHLIILRHAVPVVNIEWTYTKDSVRGCRVAFVALDGSNGFVSFGDENITFG